MYNIKKTKLCFVGNNSFRVLNLFIFTVLNENHRSNSLNNHSASKILFSATMQIKYTFSVESLNNPWQIEIYSDKHNYTYSWKLKKFEFIDNWHWQSMLPPTAAGHQNKLETIWSCLFWLGMSSEFFVVIVNGFFTQNRRCIYPNQEQITDRRC